MEFLDYYDENQKYLGTEDRNIVHRDGLWHNTVHCWLYDKKGNIYFQIRSDNNKFYTTASGHVLAGETIKEAFGREIKEEIGIDIEYELAVLADIVIWKMDKVKKDGSLFVDRAFANVYLFEYNDDSYNFKFDLSEVSGLVKVNAREVLDMFEKETGKVGAEIIKFDNSTDFKNVGLEDFLVNEFETATGKYGDILNKVIELTDIIEFN